MDEENKTEQTVEVDVKEMKKRIDFTFYSNIALVGSSNVDFFIDFVQSPPEEDDAFSTVRVFMAPDHAKKVLKALESVINSFEERKQAQEK